MAEQLHNCPGNGGATVWYAFTPTQNMRIEADTFGSNYDTTLSVYTGSRGSLTQIACNDNKINNGVGTLQSQVVFDATGGQTYYFMVGGSYYRGLLRFTVQHITNLAIDPRGSVNLRTGVATISGTVTCSRSVPITVIGSLTLTFGRFTARGTYDTNFQCSETTHWSATVTPSGSVAFGAGAATAFGRAFTNDRYLDLQTSGKVTLAP